MRSVAPKSQGERFGLGLISGQAWPPMTLAGPFGNETKAVSTIKILAILYRLTLLIEGQALHSVYKWN